MLGTRESSRPDHFVLPRAITKPQITKKRWHQHLGDPNGILRHKNSISQLTWCEPGRGGEAGVHTVATGRRGSASSFRGSALAERGTRTGWLALLCAYVAEGGGQSHFCTAIPKALNSVRQCQNLRGPNSSSWELKNRCMLAILASERQRQRQADRQKNQGGERERAMEE